MIGFCCIQGCTPSPSRGDAAMVTTCDVGEVSAFEEGGFPDSRWWDGMGDPQLKWLIDLGLEKNLDLAQVEQKLLASVQMAMQERAHLFPEIGLELSDEWQHLAQDGFYRAFAPMIPPVVNDVKAGIGLWYVFDFWGKNRALVASALGEVRAMRAERAQADLMLATGIASVYLELQGYMHKRDVMGALVGVKGEMEAALFKRSAHALDPASAVLYARKDVLAVEDVCARIDGAIQEETHALKALIGSGQSFSLEVSRETLDVGVRIPKGLSLDLIGRRPDIAAQRARVESAAQMVKVAKTEFYPNIDIAALIGLETIYINKMFLSKNYSASIKPALHLPLFTAGRLQAQLDASQARYNEAVYAYNALVIQAAKEVADVLSRILALERELGIHRESFGVLKRLEGIARGRMNHALGDVLAWLDAKAACLEEQYAILGIEYELRVQEILLIRAIGGGYIE